MSQDFLTNYHRKALADNPDAALGFWSTSMADGQHCYDEKTLDKAVQHFGAAFEAAETLFKHSNTSSIISANYFTAATVMLSKSFFNNHQEDRCVEIIQAARNTLSLRLKRSNSSDCLIHYAKACLIMVDECYRELFPYRTPTSSATQTPFVMDPSDREKSILH